MNDGANPIGALISFWMLLKLLGVLASLGGGIYALFCLSRIASSLARIADVLQWQAQQTPNNAPLSSLSVSLPTVSSPPVSTAPISTVPPENSASSTRLPDFTEHDVHPRNDSF